MVYLPTPTELVNLNNQNESVIPLNTVDSIQGIFNEIYYRTILADNYDLTEPDKSVFINLANMCPLLNPQAIHHARAIVGIWDKNTYYNDAELCFQAGYAYKRAIAKPAQTNIEMTCTLSPNPTKDISYIHFRGIPNVSVQILISDITGRRLVIENKLLDKNIVEIDTKKFVNGIYFVNVYLDKKEIYQGKLEVLK